MTAPSSGQYSAHLDLDEAFLRRLERLRVATRRARPGRSVGARRSPTHGSSVEYADFRPYLPGDDLRHLDWNAYARSGRLFMRLYHDEQNATIHLLLDVSASMDSGGEDNKLRWSKQLAGALAYVALAELDRVTISAVAGRVVGPPRNYSGIRSAMRLFNDLTSIAPVPGPTDLDAALGSFRARPAGPAILISDLLTPGWGEAGIRALLLGGHDVSVAHVLSPEEEDPSVRGDVRLVDSETSEVRDISADDALIDRYRESLAAWRTEIRDSCRGRGIPYLPVRSDMDIDDIVFGALRRHQVVA